MSAEDRNLPVLPRGWVWTRLGEVFEIILGQSPQSATYNENKLGLPFYQGKAEFGNVHPTTQKWCTAPKKIVEKGDVLISVRAPVGPTNICLEKSCIGRGLAAIRGMGGIETLFVLYLMRTFKDTLSEKGTGTTFDAITGDMLKKFSIPLPPLQEQQRIVAKIEELFTGLDAGVEALKKARAQLKRYRQAVLKHAFEGRLTEEWRKVHKNDLEPASVLLEKIKEKRRKTAREEFNELPAVDASDLPELPEGWVWTRPGEIGQVETGTTPSKSKIEYYGKDYPFYKPPDLNAGYCTSGSADGLTINGIKEARLLPAKSILITCIGATIGKTGFIKKEGAFNQQINAIIPMENILPEYIYFICISPQFQKSIIKNASATTLPILSKRKFEILLLPLPPLAEQHKIVEEIERRLSVAEEVEKTIGQGLKQAERLRQSILKRAFEGKLVPQDPSDEPASVLLEKIKLRRQQIEQRTKTRRRKASG